MEVREWFSMKMTTSCRVAASVGAFLPLRLRNGSSTASAAAVLHRGRSHRGRWAIGIQTSLSSAPLGRRTREDARRFDAMVLCSHRLIAEATRNVPRRIGAPEIDRARTGDGGG